jgi:hypothetical protein
MTSLSHYLAMAENICDRHGEREATRRSKIEAMRIIVPGAVIPNPECFRGGPRKRGDDCANYLVVIRPPLGEIPGLRSR